MCGRYSLTAPEDELVEVFDVPPLSFDYRPRYNIAPTQNVPVLARDRGGRRVGTLRWGLVPRWADDPAIGNRMINARSETAAREPAFREPFQRRRCLVPADGFFEWTKGEGGRKLPHWIHLPSRELLTFAGLWDRWRASDGGDEMCTFTILTTDAVPSLAPLHDRMPVIVPEEERERWLSPDSRPDELKELLGPWGDGVLRWHRVSTLVNSPANDETRCVEPLGEEGEDES